jgi:hypothetical protein
MIVAMSMARIVTRKAWGIVVRMLRQNAVQGTVLQVFDCAGVRGPSQCGQQLQQDDQTKSAASNHVAVRTRWHPQWL